MQVTKENLDAGWQAAKKVAAAITELNAATREAAKNGIRVEIQVLDQASLGNVSTVPVASASYSLDLKI